MPVSFSIKKLKEPDPILPKPALPYESSSDEDSELQDKDKPEDVKEPPKVVPQLFPSNDIPPVIVYKIDGQLHNEEPPVKVVEPVKVVVNPAPLPTNTIPPEESVTVPKPEPIHTVVPEITQKPLNPVTMQVQNVEPLDKVERCEWERDSPFKMEIESPQIKENLSPVSRQDTDSPLKRRENPQIMNKESPLKRTESPGKRDKDSPRRKDSPYRRSPHRRDKKKHRDRKKDYRSKSRESRRSDRKSVEREKKRERETEKESKKYKYKQEELENEIISLEDNSDDLIDLTGDQSDSKGEFVLNILIITYYVQNL